MNSKYKTIKYKKNKPSNIEDLVSIEEPLEMVVRYKKDNDWVDNSISITMRTPKNDEDLIEDWEQVRDEEEQEEEEDYY